MLQATACVLLIAAALPVCAQISWQAEEFPIGYWYGPPADHNNLETWRTVADANFTFAMGAGYGVEGNRRMLDYCHELGIKAIVHDGRIGWQMTGNDDWRETIGEIVADYADHPALLGYYLHDEPNHELFRALGEISGEFQRRDPDRIPYINLFPTYANVEQLGTPNYEDHLDKYLSIVQPTVLSYDHYALRRDGTDRPDYFENLDLIREYGLRYDVPPWNIIISLPHFGYRDPTAGEMRWQVYTSLAYGMKGIMYFTYWTSPRWQEEGNIGIVDKDGNPARLYSIVQELNAEMKALGPTLLRLTSTGVFHTGDIPLRATRLGWDAVIQLPQDEPLVIGFFRDDEGAEYAMIANRDYAEPVEFTLTVRPDVVGLTEISAHDGGQVALELADGALPMRLEPGDGRLLRLTTEFSYPEPPEPLTEIDFRFETDGDIEGWGAFHSLSNPVVRDGVLTLTFTGHDPHFSRMFMRLEPDQYTTIRVRMKLPPCEAQGQFFWTTREEPTFRDDKYLNFPVIPDGEWHEYEIPVAEHPKWAGQAVRAIRLDPTTGGAEPGSRVEIDWIVGE